MNRLLGARFSARMASEGAVYEVIVVGGGVVGSATAWRAAKRLAAAGKAEGGVLLLEQFQAGHDNGSSHGDGRIFRVAYEEADYVAMAKFALEAWQELEAETQQELLLTTGGLTIATRENAWTLDELCATFERFGFPYERLAAAEANARHPQYHLDPDAGEEAVFQASAGILRATPSVRAMWKAAKARGAMVVERQQMRTLRRAEDATIEVTTEDGRTFRARSVVLAMGAWTTRVPGLEALPLEITEESVGYFEPKAGSEGVDHTYHHMPVFLHRAPNGIEGRVDQGFYGLPQVEIKGVKVAAHHVGPAVDPDRRLAARAAGDGDATKQQREKALSTTVDFVARVFPHLEPTPTHTLTCLYSVTPDHDFVLDQHPTMPNVYVAAGFSGHGFKFGSALGEIMACLALQAPFPSLLEQAMAKGRFALKRFAEGGNKEKIVYR